MNKNLFASQSRQMPVADTHNIAGGQAYSMDAEWRLAQLAFTATFHDPTGCHRVSGESQLDQVIVLATQVDPVYLAKLAVASRQVGYMKTMPQALLLTLYARDHDLAAVVFDRVVDAPNVLKDLFTMVKSGKFGRRSFYSKLQKLVERKLRTASAGWLYNLSIGTKPSIRDIFRQIRPRPANFKQRALWGYLLGQSEDRWGIDVGSPRDFLPPTILAFDAYNKATTEEEQLQLVDVLQSIRWEAKTGHVLGKRVWKRFVQTMKPQALRMNLNTLARHGAFNDPEIVQLTVAKLSDVDEVRRSRQFPYQYLTAYKNLKPEVPHEVRRGLNRAADAACGNVAAFGCPAAVLVDVSGSMSSNTVTGAKESDNPPRCIDAAALAGVALWRNNPGSALLPFDTRVRTEYMRMDPDDTLLSLTERLAAINGGGTNCSAPLEYVNNEMSQRAFGVVVLVSDNESWADRHQGPYSGIMHEFQRFTSNQRRLGKYPHPKLICLDLAPGNTSLIPNTDSTLPVGGFSDGVFALMDQFFSGDKMSFVQKVKSIEL